jgi:uncharacterized membrane protein YkvA (DUF1232 family)
VKWKAEIRRLAQDVHFTARIVKHPAAPWSARIIAGCAVAYVLSPIQLIPTFIPVVGQLDDALVIYLCVRLIQSVTPEAIVANCRKDLIEAITLAPDSNDQCLATLSQPL